MNHRSLASWGCTAIVLVALCAPFGTSTAWAAQRNDEAVREAGKHFQRGVTLYGETDYRGALVEFKRAYELAPNAAVLYNIGETHYQLRDYASALTTFEHYLADSGPGDSHRAEVEANVRELKSRVGHLTITTVPRGAEVSIDDRSLGKAFENPVVVGVGHLKVTAGMPGRATVTQYIDVAAEDDVSVLMQLPVATPRPGDAVPAGLVLTDPAPAPPPRSSLRIAGWVATGVLAAGAVASGVLALRESSSLDTERNRYADDGMNPGYAAAKAARLDRLATRTRNFSILADSLGAAAVIVGAVTLFTGMLSGEESGARQVGLGSSGLRVTF
ncbi:MAG TPA: PEGA domain-containing protein [Polyangia bacterium]|jgi:hypothetical protein|nr:PEGA domain-containing protein [Polyangia bacterium]